MKARTWRELLRSGRLGLLLGAARLSTPFYRLVWLAAAGRYGVLAHLAQSPATTETLAHALGIGGEGQAALAAWLRVGERLGELVAGPGGWQLRSRLARGLAREEQDAVAAMLDEIASLHHALLLETPARLRRGESWTLADQDGLLVARSSRLLEPVLREASERLFPATGPVRLLEVGAGSGVYIRHAAERNPELTALGLELQPEVAAEASANLARWGLSERARIETGDVRERRPERAFDVVTLHNNIYYFPVGERVALFRHLRRFLVPGGLLLVTTGCRGGTPAMELLNLWGAATRGCGRLPDPDELVGQLEEAGLRAGPPVRLIPRESYFAFTATEPG